MTDIKRRSFLKGALAAGATAAMPASSVLGANERVNMAFVGLGGRGSGSVGWFSGIDGVEVAALCDADENRIAGVADDHPDAMTTTDMREVYENDDIDAVCVSTCNHWHVLASIWAVQAGKDVYVEKPLSWNVWEGRQLEKARKKYDRIVQGGTQQRSDPLQKKIKNFLDSGKIGDIRYVRCNRYGRRHPIGMRDKPLDPPDSVDYNMWLGPAQDEPIYRDNFHYQWHWVWNTGNGEAGNWGPHLLDDARNVVYRDEETLPHACVAGGGRLKWDDAGDTPNTQFAYFETGSVPLILDVHNLPRKASQQGVPDIYDKRRTRAFLIIECEDGYYAGGRGGGAFYDLDGEKIKQLNGNGGGGHARNFIKAVRHHDQSMLNAPVVQTHYSTAWCHMANNSYRLGKDFTKEEAKARVKGYKPWKDVVDGFYEHLEANKIDPDEADIKLGPVLQVDPEKEKLVGKSATDKAKALMDGSLRGYRDGFEVPEKV